MAFKWRHQVIRSDVDPNLCSHMALLGHNELTWVQFWNEITYQGCTDGQAKAEGKLSTSFIQYGGSFFF